MNPLAQKLNQQLNNSIALRAFSDLGKRLYFPRGVVAQTAEAAKYAHKYNATVGMATNNNDPIYLSSIKKHIKDLHVSEIFSYAPTAGIPELRNLWLKEIIRKNPGISTNISLPIVTTGLTHGISLVADMFVDSGDSVLLPDMYWGNYRLIMEERRQGMLKTFPFFDSQKNFNLTGFAEKINLMKAGSKVVLLMNFPNNPTGYTPTVSEIELMCDLIIQAAKREVKLVVISDDAYFGLFFGDQTFKQSVFAKLCDAHPNILAIKIDGATKENYVWGFRIGFLTFSAKGMLPVHFESLEQKFMAAIRSSISNSNMLTQSLLLRAIKAGSFQEECEHNINLIRQRYKKVLEVLSKKRFQENRLLSPLPFNSGYFLTFRLVKNVSDAVRKVLLHDYGIGVIAVNEEYLRVAFSTVELENIEPLIEKIYDIASEII